jgi:hypothetical protein
VSPVLTAEGFPDPDHSSALAAVPAKAMTQVIRGATALVAVPVKAMALVRGAT